MGCNISRPLQSNQGLVMYGMDVQSVNGGTPSFPAADTVGLTVTRRGELTPAHSFGIVGPGETIQITCRDAKGLAIDGERLSPDPDETWVCEWTCPYGDDGLVHPVPFFGALSWI